MDDAADAGWDSAGARLHESLLVTAAAGTDEIVLSFGTTRVEDEARVPVLQGQVALSPRAAQHLRDMLARLLAEHDARAPRP